MEKSLSKKDVPDPFDLTGEDHFVLNLVLARRITAQEIEAAGLSANCRKLELFRIVKRDGRHIVPTQIAPVVQATHRELIKGTRHQLDS